MPSYIVDESEIKGTTGAGDAFCAGCLYAIHEGYSFKEMLKLAHACASFNLQNLTSTGGAVSKEILEDFMQSASPRASIA